MGRRGKRWLFAAATALVACAAPPAPPARPPPPPAPAPLPPPPAEVPHEIQLGPIVLALSDARTAQVFHIVDRLSKWRPGLGAGYASWADETLSLGDADRAMLAAHAKLRARMGWGGLDQAFYVEDSIDVAAQGASEKKLLTPADAEAERALLAHFAPKLEALLDDQSKALEALRASIAKQAVLAAPLAAQLGRFCETEGTVEVHAFLVASPSKTSGSGGFHGGRLIVEVSPDDDYAPTFFHELFHAVLERRRGSVAIAAQKCDEPVDPETLQEGLAYAFAPGLVHEAGRDVLVGMVNADRGRALSEPAVRYERLGLAIRTDLGSALESGHDSLSAFLPRECEAWGKLVRP